MPWTQLCPRIHLYKPRKVPLTRTWLNAECDWLFLYQVRRKWHKCEVWNRCLPKILLPQCFLTNLQNQYLYPIGYELEAGNTEGFWNKRWWRRFSKYLEALRNNTYWIKILLCYSTDMYGTPTEICTSSSWDPNLPWTHIVTVYSWSNSSCRQAWIPAAKNPPIAA